MVSDGFCFNTISLGDFEKIWRGIAGFFCCGFVPGAEVNLLKLFNYAVGAIVHYKNFNRQLIVFYGLEFLYIQLEAAISV